MAEVINDIPAAINALRTFATDPPASTPQALREELQGAASEMSPVDAIVRATESMFANLPDLTKAGKELLADLAALATTFGWHGLAAGDQRGLGIVRAASREAGREPPTGSWPDAADDPKPLDRYAPAALPATDAAAPVKPPAVPAE